MSPPRRHLLTRSLAAALILAAVALACAAPRSGEPAASSSATPAADAPAGTVDPVTGQQLNAPPDPVTADLPSAVDANAFATRTPIKHVVFLIMENRSFDNVFGTYPGADGAADRRRSRRHAPADRSAACSARTTCRTATTATSPRSTAARWTASTRPTSPTSSRSRSSTRTRSARTGPGPSATRSPTTSSPRRSARRSRTTCTRSPRPPGGALDNPWQPPPNLVDDAAAGLREVLGVRHRARRLRRGDRSRGLHGQGRRRASTSRPRATC